VPICARPLFVLGHCHCATDAYACGSVIEPQYEGEVAVAVTRFIADAAWQSRNSCDTEKFTRSEIVESALVARTFFACVASSRLREGVGLPVLFGNSHMSSPQKFQDDSRNILATKCCVSGWFERARISGATPRQNGCTWEAHERSGPVREPREGDALRREDVASHVMEPR
jgi:hypothetical protein